VSTPVDSRLAELLGSAPPPSVAALPEAARAELARVLAEALARQSAAVEAALADSVKQVPLPLRGLARRALFG
jgi:hypothetical protein